MCIPIKYCLVLIVTCLSLNGGGSLMAQSYPFIALEQNVLWVPMEQQARFLALRTQLSEPPSQHLHIMHFGDSHLQADFFPERMRCLLKVKDRGLLFPFAAVNSNNPNNFYVTKLGQFEYIRNALATAPIRAGLTGASAYSTDAKASIQIKLNPRAQSTQFSRVRLFHDTHRGAPEVIVSGASDLLYRFTNKTHNYSVIAFQDPLDSLNISWDYTNATDSLSTLYGLFLEGSEASITYSGLGVNGAKIQSLDFCTLLESQLKVCRPELIILSYGANDCYSGFDSVVFMSAYRRVIHKIRRVLPETIILLTTPGDAYGADQRPIAALVQLKECIFALAQSDRCAVWDFYSVMGGFGSMKYWLEAGLSNKDALHLIKKGYELQADLFDQALRFNDLKSF